MIRAEHSCSAMSGHPSSKPDLIVPSQANSPSTSTNFVSLNFYTPQILCFDDCSSKSSCFYVNSCGFLFYQHTFGIGNY